MEKTGLILEGGGMRGMYTAGVLDYFLDNQVEFDYIIGVSAGSNMATSYISKQRGRNKRVGIDFVDDKRYLSLQNYIRNREAFGMDFIFDEIPKQHVPFDMDEFLLYKGQFVVACTNCDTGETVYYNKKVLDKDLLTILRASSSLPFMAPIVQYDNKNLLDGGVTDPIPTRKAERDGIKKQVIVLTRPVGYRKKSSRLAKWFKVKGFPKIDEAMMRRAELYNETLDYIEEKEKEADTIVIRPSKDLKIDRMERNKMKLDVLYQLGYEDAAKHLDDILSLQRKTNH